MLTAWSLEYVVLIFAAVAPAIVSARQNTSVLPMDTQFQPFVIPKPDCPPCFNCLLPSYKCGNYGTCNEYDGQCKCPEGWGGVDCLTPQCGSLADGEKRHPRPDGGECECEEGWGGINCNVCETDEACTGFPLGEFKDAIRTTEEAEPAQNMTCYKGGATVRNQHQMCDVTNRKILDMLPDRPPQVTFNCETMALNAGQASSGVSPSFALARKRNLIPRTLFSRPLKDSDDKDPASPLNNKCAFQFWIGKVESFYCSLEQCSSAIHYGSNGKNSTIAACEKIKCACVPGRMLCGEEGSVDIGEFLEEEIKGPAKFSCVAGTSSDAADCTFEEPAMNDLIDSIFGDAYITLKCRGGECLRHDMVPGYIAPPKADNTMWIALSCAGAASIFLLAVAVLWYAGRVNTIQLPTEEGAARLMTEHIPANLQFSDVSYTLPASGQEKPHGGRPGPKTQTVLYDVSGQVKAGEIMAIMGPSGAGKSTLLDILARRTKRGIVGGSIQINGREISREEMRKVTGYVDQEDTLMSTLTVYETVLYSALLRLPREMSYQTKEWRTLETMEELGILGIRDKRIGESGHRSISGGEKRRVSIACELVTSPSILFLDEPTSGLDAYNAYNVVESLVALAHNYNRTVVFTIHQPRSNIVALFDQLILLAQGQVIYAGPMAKCQRYFEKGGFKCPEGFNIADYLIDLTMTATTSNHESHSVAGSSPVGSRPPSLSGGEAAASQVQLPTPETHEASPSNNNESQTQPASILSEGARLFRKTFNGISSASLQHHEEPPKPVHLQTLVEMYRESDIAKEVESGITHAAASNGVAGGQTRDVAEESNVLRGRRRATWGTQFRILSGRAFKNLYRDPALLAAHYVASIIIAVICGLLMFHVSNDMSGFQNRLGFFFFTLALFGFSCLSSISLFANERILFMRERANGYYSSFTYFSSKVLFDIVPLRVVPPLVYGSIVYGLVGLVPSVVGFWKFLLTLVLFNLTTASVVLFISIAIANVAVASLVGTLIMLYNLLFAGLLVNRDTINPWLDWLHTVSFFHAAYEGLAVNELRYLQLKEIKYGVELDVPAATILSIFGFRAQSFWWPDMVLLAVMFTFSMILSFVWLHKYVKEKR